MWENYSGWFSEAFSAFSGQSSMAKAKAAASGLIGATPEVMQTEHKSGYEKELGKLRGGYTAKNLKKHAQTLRKRAIKKEEGIESYKGVRTPKGYEGYGWTQEQFHELSTKYEEALGVKPKSWELYLFNMYGFRPHEFTDKELSVFKSKEAAGKSAKGLLAHLSATNDETSRSPWV